MQEFCEEIESQIQTPAEIPNKNLLRPFLVSDVQLTGKHISSAKEHTDMNKLEPLQALHIEPRTQAEDKDSSSTAAEDLPTIVDTLPSSEKEKEEIKKWTQNSNKAQIEILISGRIGVGKLPLVNAIVGKEVAKFGKELHVQTRNVRCYKMATEEGVEVVVWDSPGLQDGSGNEEEYLAQLKEKCSNVDIIIYCIDISATRSSLAEYEAEESNFNDINMLTATFGPQWWKHSIFVMTRANLLEARLEVRQGDALEQHFNDILKAWEKKIHGALSEAGVPEKLVEEVPVVPAGYIKKPHLPGHEYWLSQLWSAFLKRAKQHCQPQIVKLNQGRFREKDVDLKD